MTPAQTRAWLTAAVSLLALLNDTRHVVAVELRRLEAHLRAMQAAA